MKKRTRNLIQGLVLLLAPLLLALAFGWYLPVTIYYLVLFGIFIYGELGWKGLMFHILFFSFLFWLASL